MMLAGRATTDTPYQPLSRLNPPAGDYCEVRLSEGHDWFVIRDRDVERSVERQIRPAPRYDSLFARDCHYWRPYWRHYGPRAGWQAWDPYCGDSFWADRADGRAFDARDVIARIGPSVEYPER